MTLRECVDCMAQVLLARGKKVHKTRNLSNAIWSEPCVATSSLPSNLELQTVEERPETFSVLLINEQLFSSSNIYPSFVYVMLVTIPEHRHVGVRRIPIMSGQETG